MYKRNFCLDYREYGGRKMLGVSLSHYIYGDILVPGVNQANTEGDGQEYKPTWSYAWKI